MSADAQHPRDATRRAATVCAFAARRSTSPPARSSCASIPGRPDRWQAARDQVELMAAKGQPPPADLVVAIDLSFADAQALLSQPEWCGADGCVACLIQSKVADALPAADLDLEASS